MHIRKAVITAASPAQNGLPLQRLVDSTGEQKTALELLIEEVASVDIDEIAIVIRPGSQQAFEDAAGPFANRIHFIEQDQPRGYGDALFRASGFLADQPFLHLVEDHLYLSHTHQTCAQQLVEVARQHKCAVSAVQPTRENKLYLFGVVGGGRLPQKSDLYDVARVVEKPTPTQAEQELLIAGLRAGFYQCFLGMHIITPQVLEILGEMLSDESRDQVTLSDALNQLAERERYYAYELQGRRYNIGVKYGLLIAQLAISLSGNDRDQILTELVELLALRHDKVDVQ